MSDVSSGVKKSAKQIAKDSARKAAKEPLEVMKTAGRQVSGQEKAPQQDKPTEVKKEDKGKEEISQEEKKKIQTKSRNLLQAYKSELEDIRKRELFKDVQRRIQEGEDVNVAAIEGLSREQKQVLKAQKEALQARAEEEKAKSEDKEVVEPSSKPKRSMFAGVKGKLEKLKRKTEIRLPPSG